MTSERQLPLFGEGPEDARGRRNRGGRPGALRDAAARAFAVDPANNVVLEASAGTGKTTVLVSRYVNLLRAGVDPSNILAITFTRQAAAEMRDRIIRQLRRSADGPPADRDRWRGLRDRLGDIAISTIDAFCLSLLREFPLEADLDPGFGMTDETEAPRLVQQALDRTLAVCGALAGDDAAVAMVLARLGPGRVRTALAHLLERRLVAPAALQRFLMAGPRGLTADGACRAAAARVARVLAGVDGGLERFLADGPLEHPRFRALARALPGLAEQDRSQPEGLRLVLDRVREYFLTAAGEARRRFAPFRADHCRSPAAWRRHRDLARAAAPAVAEALAAFDRDLNVVLARGVQRLFAVAVTEYERELAARSVLDFSGVLARALDLLRRMDEFAQSRYRLESRYHHVLVDEFQDTSRAQWELVSLLVKSWGEGLGLVHDAPVPPSVFVVGDRKQSIYGFRDAEAAVIEDAADSIGALRPEGGVRRSISHSFRAVPALLAFVNDLFGAVDKADRPRDGFRYDARDRFPVEPAPAPPRGAADDGPAADPPLGLVLADSLEGCAERVAGEVARLLDGATVRDRDEGTVRPAAPSDVAILFRSRETHREFQAALEARAIPACVYKGLGFFDADEIKDCRALLRFLADPASELRAAALLRSRLVGVTDRTLAELAGQLAEALRPGGPGPVLERLDPLDRDVLLRLRASVPRWLAAVDRVPPAETIDRILADCAYAFELQGPRLVQARENLKKLRGLVRRVQNRGFATMARIAEHVDRLSGDVSNAVVDAFDAVNLMTVHAAKGLEFPVVFLVELARGAGGPPPPIRVVADRGDGEPSVSVAPFRSAADRDQRDREREESKRLLYVAATRARDRLYLSATLAAGHRRAGDREPGRGDAAGAPGPARGGREGGAGELDGPVGPRPQLRGGRGGGRGAGLPAARGPVPGRAGPVRAVAPGRGAAPGCRDGPRGGRGGAGAGRRDGPRGGRGGAGAGRRPRGGASRPPAPAGGRRAGRARPERRRSGRPGSGGDGTGGTGAGRLSGAGRGGRGRLPPGCRPGGRGRAPRGRMPLRGAVHAPPRRRRRGARLRPRGDRLPSPLARRAGHRRRAQDRRRPARARLAARALRRSGERAVSGTAGRRSPAVPVVNRSGSRTDAASAADEDRIGDEPVRPGPGLGRGLGFGATHEDDRIERLVAAVPGDPGNPVRAAGPGPDVQLDGVSRHGRLKSYRTAPAAAQAASGARLAAGPARRLVTAFGTRR